MFERGMLVLVPFPFTNLESSKVRPALIISDPKYVEADLTVIFISSRLPKRRSQTDLPILPSDSHFKQTGLRVASVFKCNKIATVDKKIVLGEMGFIDKEIQKKIDQRLKLALGLKS